MARIELRNCNILIKDGFGGTAEVDDASISGGNTTLLIDNVADLTNDTDVIPVGARFTVESVDPETIFTVTDQDSNKVFNVTVDATSGNFTITFNSQTTGNIAYNASPSTGGSSVRALLEALSNVAPGDVVVSGSPGDYTIELSGVYEGLSTPTLTVDDVDLMGGTGVAVTTEQPGAVTWMLTFTPALDGGDLAVNGDTITFLPQQIDIKIGDGDIKYTEADNFTYDLDRGELDTVRKGNDAPLEVSLNFVYEHITTGTSETIAPMDALKRINGASAWVSSAEDKCEPYAVDLVVIHTPPCGTSEPETTVFTDFRSEKREVGFKDANIAVSGKCNTVEPSVTRG